MSTPRDLFALVVGFLGVTLLLCVGGIIVLAGFDKAVPSILENIATGCSVGIAGLLARTPTTGPQEVQVVNSPQYPVPVEESS